MSLKFTPEEDVLRECPMLIIAEITIGGVTQRTSNLSPNGEEFPMVLAATMFSGDTLESHELAVLKANVEAVALKANWGRDDATGMPIECAIQFEDDGTGVTLRYFALPQLSLDVSDQPAN